MQFRNFKRRLVINTALLFGVLSLVAFALPMTTTPTTSHTATSGTTEAKPKPTGALPSYKTPSISQQVAQPSMPAQGTTGSPSAAAQPATNASTSQLDTNPSSDISTGPTGSSGSTQNSADGSSSSASYACINYSCSVSKQPSPPTSCGCSTYPPYSRVATNVMCPMTACIE